MRGSKLRPIAKRRVQRGVAEHTVIAVRGGWCGVLLLWWWWKLLLLLPSCPWVNVIIMMLHFRAARQGMMMGEIGHNQCRWLHSL